MEIDRSTGLNHRSKAVISEVARWLASIPVEKRPKPIIPMIKARFGLSTWEACQAISEANKATGEGT